ncbi:GNAT family N-acetyltransferase [Pandoraea terrae]|nr:GNAT family N-acetyltransferase [Pandoraea terrae]
MNDLSRPLRYPPHASPRQGVAPVVRASRDDDLPAIVAIYAHHVLHGTASFEEIAPDITEMRARRDKILAAKLPYLVAERDGRVLGYAYATPYRPRSAYRFTVEDSVYIDPAAIGQGAGRALLEAVIGHCEAGPWRQMIANVGDSANAASLGLHAACGFQRMGTLYAVGFKFGRWLDTVLMQRRLNGGESSLPQA